MLIFCLEKYRWRQRHIFPRVAAFLFGGATPARQDISLVVPLSPPPPFPPLPLLFAICFSPPLYSWRSRKEEEGAEMCRNEPGHNSQPTRAGGLAAVGFCRVRDFTTFTEGITRKKRI